MLKFAKPSRKVHRLKKRYQKVFLCDQCGRKQKNHLTKVFLPDSVGWATWVLSSCRLCVRTKKKELYVGCSE